MTTGIFNALRKYSARPNHDPLENFITQAFFYILQSNADFSAYFLEAIIPTPQRPAWLNATINGKKELNWSTQHNFDGFLPDLVCQTEDGIIVFENKVWAYLHDNQINNYRDCSDKKFPGRNLVLMIASVPEQNQQDPDGFVLWSEVYNLIKYWKPKNKEIPFYFADFLRLLESEGLSPSKPIQVHTLPYFQALFDAKRNLKDIVKKVEHCQKSWPILNSEKYFYEDRWERLGLISNKADAQWKPAIFVGVLLDTSDHRVINSNVKKGPDFCLILSFDKKYHYHYPENKSYLALMNVLRQHIDDLGSGWEVYEPLNDLTQIEKNKWHPLFIRKPMFDIFSGKQEFNDQVNAFSDTCIQLLSFINKFPELEALRNSLA